MSYKTIIDCPVTKTTSQVLYPYIDDKKDYWYNIYGGYNTGIDIECDNVYSICPSVVIFIGQENKYYTVVIQYTSEICFRYCHLKNVNVERGQICDSGELIGKASKFCSFELLTKTQNNSTWPVRISSKTFYIQNPEEYADGTIILLGSGKVNPDDPDVNLDEVFSYFDFPVETINFYGDGY
ncbi:MAG: M23 family metallopeptidase [Oscillospiraceae bacterium]|nr:M23 family metallopeptidase [Oscillospiraceae bacterium]